MSDFEADPERVELLRTVADDIRETGEGSEAEQLAALVHRVSDLYDDREDTSPQEIYIAMRSILGVKERGGLGR